MKKRIERMGRIEAAINPMYCVPKRSDLSLIGSAFEAAGFRCVRIRTECEAEHRTKGGDPRRHGMLGSRRWPSDIGGIAVETD